MGVEGTTRAVGNLTAGFGYHYVLSNEDLHKWLKGIAIDKATITEPPETLQETLKARRRLREEATPVKAQQATPTTSTSSSKNPMLAGLAMVAPVIQCIGEVLKLARPVEPTLPAYHPSHTYLPGNFRPASRERQSSPVRVDSARADHLYTYFQWAKERYPAQAAPLDAAFRRAVNEELTLDVIAEMKAAADWKCIEIPTGIGSRLRGGVKDFLRDLDRGWTPRARVEERRQTGITGQVPEQGSSNDIALDALADAANMAQ